MLVRAPEKAQSTILPWWRERREYGKYMHVWLWYAHMRSMIACS